MDINAIDATDYSLAWDIDTHQYWVWEPEDTAPTEVSKTSINAIKPDYFQNDSDWTWDDETGMMWTYNSYSEEWISEQDYKAVLQPDSTPAPTMSINFV